MAVTPGTPGSVLYVMSCDQAMFFFSLGLAIGVVGFFAGHAPLSSLVGTIAAGLIFGCIDTIIAIARLRALIRRAIGA